MRTSIEHKGTASCRVKFQLSREKFEIVRRYFGKTAQVRFANGAAIYSHGCGWYSIYGDGVRVDAALVGLNHVKFALAKKTRPAQVEEKFPSRSEIYFNPDVRPRIKVVYDVSPKGFKVAVLKDYGRMAREFYESEMKRQAKILAHEASKEARLVSGLSRLAERFGKSLNYSQ